MSFLEQGHSLPASKAGDVATHYRPRPQACDVAIVVPVFKHSVLLGEAITSVLAQRGPHVIAIVLVDDGCPYVETEVMCRAFALANQDVYYLRKNNGGLSSARNHGIEFVMSQLPKVEAIFFLDADNRLTPTVIRDTMAFLRSHPDASWIYPNIDKMGIEWNGNYNARYSKLTHLLFDNVCEAGSLVSRRVFEAGVHFDESMRDGYEDWEFWLQCIDRGFSGINYPHFGFEYRQRAESMVRDSNRQREAIRAYMRKKHRKLFRFDHLLALEHMETPRYACLFSHSLRMTRFTDPRCRHEEVDLEGFCEQYWQAALEPDTFGIPAFIAWLGKDTFELLQVAGVINTVFLAAERLADEYHFVRLSVELTDRTYGLGEIEHHQAGEERAGAHGWITRSTLLTECVNDPSDGWLRSIAEERPLPRVVDLIVQVPRYAAAHSDGISEVGSALFDTVDRLKEIGVTLSRVRWNWRLNYFPPVGQRHTLLRDHLQAQPISNRLKDGNRLEIGIVLPIATFGGVEKVSYNVARELKAAGHTVHLFIAGATTAVEFDEFRDVFATKNFLGGTYALEGGDWRFMGHDVALASDERAQVKRVLGWLLGLDVVINAQVAPLSAALGELRRHGVKTVGHFHVIDESKCGRQVGHPYIGLGVEHAYDLFLSCSRNLIDFFHGMGVPAAKLAHIANAPSYHLPPETVSAILDERAARGHPERLTVLFLGRLDRQKGVERLYAVMQTAVGRKLPVDWLIVGGHVVEAGGGGWSERLTALGAETLPPVYEEAKLAALVAKADVLLLTSRWEGAPLIILEAQRLGCIPMATDVGAVRELIDDDVDGILLPDGPDHVIVEAIMTELEALVSDSHRTRRLSLAASGRLLSVSWATSLGPLRRTLDMWFTHTPKQ
jgi:glycosyltransferase involved in cell wall biosynthesis